MTKPVSPDELRAFENAGGALAGVEGKPWTTTGESVETGEAVPKKVSFIVAILEYSMPRLLFAFIDWKIRRTERRPWRDDPGGPDHTRFLKERTAGPAIIKIKPVTGSPASEAYEEAGAIGLADAPTITNAEWQVTSNVVWSDGVPVHDTHRAVVNLNGKVPRTSIAERIEKASRGIAADTKSVRYIF